MELNEVYNIQALVKDEIDFIYTQEKNVWKILSLISWILLISSQLNLLEFNLPFSMVELYIPEYLVKNTDEHVSFDFFPQYAFLIINLIGFLIYLIFTIYQRDENVHLGLFGKITKFHFIPLLLASSLYIMSESLNYKMIKNHLEGEIMLTVFIINSFFSFVGFIYLILIYMKTKLNCHWYITFFIKKGVFSSLIMLFWGNLLLNVIIIFPKSDFYILYLFPILRGLLPICFSFVFKDIMFLFISFLYSLKTINIIYNYFYSLSGEANKKWYEIQLTFISFIVIALTLIALIVIIIVFKEKIYLS